MHKNTELLPMLFNHDIIQGDEELSIAITDLECKLGEGRGSLILERAVAEENMIPVILAGRSSRLLLC